MASISRSKTRERWVWMGSGAIAIMTCGGSGSSGGVELLAQIGAETKPQILAYSSRCASFAPAASGSASSSLVQEPCSAEAEGVTALAVDSVPRFGPGREGRL